MLLAEEPPFCFFWASASCLTCKSIYSRKGGSSSLNVSINCRSCMSAAFLPNISPFPLKRYSFETPYWEQTRAIIRSFTGLLPPSTWALMYRKNKSLPKDFGDNFRNLPLKLRVKILLAARRLLEAQREIKGLVGSGKNSEGGKNGKIGH